MAGKVSKFGSGSKLLALAIAAALIAACGKSDDQAAKTVAQPAKTDAAKAADTAAPAAATSDQAAAPAPLKSLSVSELLKRAGAALADSRFVAPPGNNAAEFYLAVLDKDSNNNAARDGLREMFPMATGAIEQQINAGQARRGQARDRAYGQGRSEQLRTDDPARQARSQEKAGRYRQGQAAGAGEGARSGEGRAGERACRRGCADTNHHDARDHRRCASASATSGTRRPGARAGNRRRRTRAGARCWRQRVVPRRERRSSSIASARCTRPTPPATARRVGSKSRSPSPPTAR